MSEPFPPIDVHANLCARFRVAPTPKGSFARISLVLSEASYSETATTVVMHSSDLDEFITALTAVRDHLRGPR